MNSIRLESQSEFHPYGVHRTVSVLRREHFCPHEKLTLCLRTMRRRASVVDRRRVETVDTRAAGPHVNLWKYTGMVTYLPIKRETGFTRLFELSFATE